MYRQLVKLVAVAALTLGCLCACDAPTTAVVNEKTPAAPAAAPAETAPKRPQVPKLTQTQETFYDFTLDDDGKYFDEALFPAPAVLQKLKQEWEETWLATPAPDDDLADIKVELAARMKENGESCGLLWAFTGDFNDNGTEETFFSYGATGGIFMDTAGLYLLEANGNLQLLSQSPGFQAWLIRYPKRTQLLTETSYGTGLSLHAEVYGCENTSDEAAVLLSVGTSGFSKDGCFLCAFPRVGSGSEVTAQCYYWDDLLNIYNRVPCVEIALEELPDGIPAERQDCTLVRAATVAKQYYFCSYLDNKNEEHIQLYRLNDDGIPSEVSSFYRYPLDLLLNELNFQTAMSNAIPLQRTPIDDAEKAKAIEFLRDHVDFATIPDSEKYPILFEPVRRNGKPVYRISVGCDPQFAYRSERIYFVAPDYGEITKATPFGGDAVIWSASEAS